MIFDDGAGFLRAESQFLRLDIKTFIDINERN